MKKIGTFQIITVAIGILVAIVIAWTIWVRTPGEGHSGDSSSRKSVLPFAANNIFESVQSLIDLPAEP